MASSSVIRPEKIHGKCSNGNGMVDFPCSDEFRDIYKRNEHDLDVFGLVGNEVRNLKCLLPLPK